MNEPTSRLQGICGLAAVGAVVAGSGLAGSETPAIGARDSEIAAYLRSLDPGAAEWAGAGLEVLGLLALLAFFALLAARLDRSAAGVVIGAAGAGVALKIASMTPVLAIWLRPDPVDPAVGGLALDANSVAFNLTTALLGVAVLAAAVGALRSGGLPRWAAGSGVAVGVLMLAAVATVTTGFVLGFLLFLLWTVAVSAHLLRPRGAGITPRPGRAPA